MQMRFSWDSRETQNGVVTHFTLTHFARFFREFTLETSQIRGSVSEHADHFPDPADHVSALGFLVSYFLYKKIPLSGVYRVLFFLPTIIPGNGHLFVFICSFIGVDGPIAPVFQKLFNLDYTPELLCERSVCEQVRSVADVLARFSRVISFLWGGTLGRIPSSVIESAKLDGVAWFREAFFDYYSDGLANVRDAVDVIGRRTFRRVG